MRKNEKTSKFRTVLVHTHIYQNFFDRIRGDIGFTIVSIKKCYFSEARRERRGGIGGVEGNEGKNVGIENLYLPVSRDHWSTQNNV